MFVWNDVGMLLFILNFDLDLKLILSQFYKRHHAIDSATSYSMLQKCE